MTPPPRTRQRTGLMRAVQEYGQHMAELGERRAARDMPKVKRPPIPLSELEAARERARAAFRDIDAALADVLKLSPQRSSARSRPAPDSRDGPSVTASEARELRLQWGLTRPELATVLAYSVRAVEEWEAGRRRVPPSVARRLVRSARHARRLIIAQARQWREDGKLAQILGQPRVQKLAEEQRQRAEFGTPLQIPTLVLPRLRILPAPKAAPRPGA